MDPQATDLLLSSEIEMHIIPGNVSSEMTFSYQETMEHFRDFHPLTDFLVDR